MDYRNFDRAVNQFGFRLQYNRLFKPEYLPARVRYNQFFFVVLAGLGYSFCIKNKVSVDTSNKGLTNRCIWCHRCGSSLMRTRPTWARDDTTRCLAASLIQSPTALTALHLARTSADKTSLFEKAEYRGPIQGRVTSPKTKLNQSSQESRI